MSTCTASLCCARRWLIAFAILTILAPLSAVGSTFSGKVVDPDGEPWPGWVLVLRTAQLHDSGFASHSPDAARITSTGLDGAFRFTSVPTGAIALTIIRDDTDGQPSAWVRSIDIGGVTVHLGPFMMHMGGGLVLTLDAETDFEDATITAVKRSLATGRVLEADGTPVTHARLEGTHAHWTSSGRGHGSARIETDEHGRYFMWLDEVATHTLAVSRGDQSAEREFEIRYDGEDIHGLDLVFGDAPAKPVLPEWIANPRNGHRYRVVEEDGWFECHQTAISMDAHLVTIEDAAELAWLVAAFGDEEPFWIGLTDERREGDWEWVTGEPLEFTNWAEAQPQDGHATGADYALMSWLPTPDPRGRWRAVDPTTSDWHRVRKATVEKDATAPVSPPR
jgi:hypothetical protein